VSDLGLVVSLFAPLFLGLVFHGFCIKFGWLARLAVPIDRGAQFRDRPWFGPNKTWRGIVAVAGGSALGYTLQGLVPELQPPALRPLPPPLLASLGFALGGASMLSELLNSFLKRQLGIGAGQPGRGSWAPFFYVADQVDFLLGAWLVASAWVSPSWVRVLESIVFVLVVHQAISALGALLGMRSSGR
jgi:hypothetical protein